MDGVHGRGARATAPGGCRVGAPDGAARRPALCRVRATCRLCGFSVHGFLNGTTCVLQVDGRALRACCRAAGGAGARRGPTDACAGLNEAIRAARKPCMKPCRKP